MRAQLDVLRPVEAAPPAPFAALLAREGSSFEDDVVATLHARRGAEAVVVAGDDPSEREAATVAALRDGVPLVVGGRLPVDVDRRRVGEPDLLVRVEDVAGDGRWRYAPVDVKGHRTLGEGGAPVVVHDLGSLAVPDGSASRDEVGRRDRTTRGDLLQLSHYHRLLEAIGHGHADRAWGGVLGREGVVAWYALDEPLWSTPTADPALRRKARTSLEVYDFEFAFRLDVAAVALRHLDDPAVPLRVEPVRCGECPSCPWREHCLPQLVERDDPSLLPRVPFTTWRALRDAGLTTVAAMAAASAPPAVEGIADGDWAELRLQAAARTSDAPITPRTVTDVTPPRADVEVDVDMENVLDGAYLWGVQVTDRAGAGVVEEGYRGFVTWAAPLDEDAVAEVFLRFWTWLGDLRDRCAARGLSLAAYCWYEAAENRHLRAGGALTGREGEVEDFIDSPGWIDLHRWFDDRFVTGHGASLKVVASRLGFAWRDDDPSGASSMLWHEEATDPAVPADRRRAARRRLLAYNEDDVRATLAIRDRLTAPCS